MTTKTKATKATKPATAPIGATPIALENSQFAALPTLAELATAAAAPAPAAPKAPTPKAKATSAKLTQPLVIVKQFKPRTNQKGEDGQVGRYAQDSNWDAVCEYFDTHESATYAELVAAVEEAGKKYGYEKTCNARGFVQGRLRNGHLAAA